MNARPAVIVLAAGKGMLGSEAQVTLRVVRATGLMDAFGGVGAADSAGGGDIGGVGGGGEQGKMDERDLNIFLRAAVLPHTRTASDHTEWVQSPALYSCSAYPDIDCTLSLPGAGDYVSVEVWHRPLEPVTGGDNHFSAALSHADFHDVFLGSLLLRLPPTRGAVHGWYALHRVENGVPSAATGALELELSGCALTPLPPRGPDVGTRALQLFVEDASLPQGHDMASCYIRYSMLGEPPRTSPTVAVGSSQWCNLQLSDQITVSGVGK